MNLSDTPWMPGGVLNFVFLLVATSVTLAVPVVYALHINLRDPLARAVLAGTSATGFVFLATVTFTVAYHLGWNPSPTEENWVTRLLYSLVIVGKATFLWALMQSVSVIRKERQSNIRDRRSRR